jgi:hypothetical protein
MTDLQMQFMNLIARCEMNQINGAVPHCADDVNTYLWADERASAMGISEKAVGGVITSLQTAGLIGIYIDKDDSGVWFTEAGFAAWNAGVCADKA